MSPNRHKREFLHESSQVDSPLPSMLMQSRTVRSQMHKTWPQGTFLTAPITVLGGHLWSQEA